MKHLEVEELSRDSGFKYIAGPMAGKAGYSLAAIGIIKDPRPYGPGPFPGLSLPSAAAPDFNLRPGPHPGNPLANPGRSSYPGGFPVKVPRAKNKPQVNFLQQSQEAVSTAPDTLRIKLSPQKITQLSRRSSIFTTQITITKKI
jgi:hypothetical protein